MQAMWSRAQARVSHRLAMHFGVAPFRMSNDSPIVSFTFDDVPRSAATLGADMLESRGARGTFYVAGGLLDAASPDWEMVDGDGIVALHDKGHEIGCHTFTHRRACDLDERAMSGEIDRNRRYLQRLDPTIGLENFAYPYGYGSIHRKRQLRNAFRSCRSIVPGVNSGAVDLQFLQALPLIDGRIDRAEVDAAFDEVVNKAGWLIFYTHDVAPLPSRYGCTPGLLRHALDAAQRRKVEILTVSEALRCVGA